MVVTSRSLGTSSTYLPLVVSSLPSGRVIATVNAPPGFPATGPGGAVRVTVAASGALTDLWLDVRVRQWPAESPMALDER